MPDFNPDVPQTAPTNFMGWSKPISGYQGNKSTETLLKGLGTDIDQGAQLLDTSVKSDIADQINRGITTLRDNYKDRLMTVYDQSMDNPDSLLPDQNGQLPQDAKGDIDHTLGTLQAARKSGHFSDMYLDMQYDSFLKGVRSKYQNSPRYLEYIDETASKSLDRGLPANREIRQVTSDLNANIQTAKEERTKAQDLAIAKLAGGGDPEAQAAWQYRTLLPEKEKADLINRKQGEQADIARLKSARDATDDPGARAASGREEAKLRLDSATSSFFHTFTMGNGGATPEQLVSEINDLGASDEQKLKAKLTLQTYMAAFKANQQKVFKQVDPKTGRSLDQDIGGKSGDLIDQYIDQLQSFSNWVDKGQGGAVATTVDHVKATSNPATSDAIPVDNKAHIANVNSVVKNNPNGDAFLAGLATGTPGSSGTRAAANARHIAVAAGNDYRGNPNSPLNMEQVLEESKSKFSPDAKGEAASRDYFNNLVGWYKDILMQKDNPAVQKNTAYTMYGPGNGDVLKHFPVETSSVKGQASVYNQWFAPAVDREMFTNLGKSDANLLQSYIQNKKDSFGKYVLPGEVKNMDDMSAVKGLKWSWDNVGHQLKAYYPGDKPPEGFDKVIAATNRLNIGLATIDSMNKYTKEDANTEMFQWLQEAKLGNGPASKAIRDAITQSFSAEQQGKQTAATKAAAALKKLFEDTKESSGSDDDDK